MVNKTQPLITIGIPTYNRADSYLRQTLQSAVNQTYPNVEIVVSDNGSTDNTGALVKSFSDPRLRYFRHPENVGVNNNFNSCLKQSRGDYFLLLHDDDMIDSDFVEACMRAAGYDTDVGIIRTGTRLIDSQGQVLREVPNRVGGLSIEDFFLGWFTGKTALYLCSTLFNTRRLREMGGFESPKNYLQDVVAEAQLAARFGRVDVQDVKASFRKHGDARTFAAKIDDWCKDSFFVLDLMCGLASEKRTLVRNEGMRFFARMNCGIARRIESPTERISTYFRILRRFEYRFSPLELMVSRNRFLRRMRNVPGKVRRLLAGGVQSG